MSIKTQKISVYTNFYSSVLLGDGKLGKGRKLEYLHKSIIAVCKKGEALIEINSKQYLFEEDHLVVVFPFQKATLLRSDNDCCMMLVEIPEYVFRSFVFNFPHIFIGYFLQNPILALSKNNILNIQDYISFIEKKVNEKNNSFCEKIIFNALYNLYLEVYNLIVPYCKDRTFVSNDLIFEDFVSLLMKYCKKNKDVGFYADKLCITPKHLNKIVKKNIDGKTAKEWIDYFVMMEIKSDLNTKHRSLKEIASQNGFSSQTSFYKYFKKQTGISPKEYVKKTDNFT